MDIKYVAGDGTGDYSADGVSDQVTINTALNWANNTSETREVYLKGPFTYIIDGTVLFGSNTILTGDSTATIKLIDNAGWSTGIPLMKNSASANENITITGFKIDGNRVGNSSVGSGLGYYNLINMSNCKNITVSNMNMQNGHGDGLKTNACTNITFLNNTISAIGHDGLYAMWSSNIDASYNTIANRTNSGLRLYNSNIAKLVGNSITSYNNEGGSGIEIQKSDKTVMNDIEIKENIIYNTALSGIWVFGAGPYLNSDAYINIHHNLIYGTGWVTNLITGGILCAGFNSNIENNTIDGSYGYGVAYGILYKIPPFGYGYTSTLKNNIITNTILDVSSSNGYGVYNAIPCTHTFDIKNNCFYNNTNGDFKNVSTPPASVYSDPLYVNRTSHDYHLQIGSLAVGMGVYT